MRYVAVLLLVAAGCGSEAVPHDEATLGSMRFDIPAAWNRSDWKQTNVAGSQWVPADNERKESLTVIRSESSPAMAKAEPAVLAQMLATAQDALADVRASKVTSIQTRKGLHGARVDVDFHPAGSIEPYHRVHVVLVDGVALVHVMYTARNPDNDHRALELVLDSIRHEEG